MEDEIVAVIGLDADQFQAFLSVIRADDQETGRVEVGWNFVGVENGVFDCVQDVGLGDSVLFAEAVMRTDVRQLQYRNRLFVEEIDATSCREGGCSTASDSRARY